MEAAACEVVAPPIKAAEQSNNIKQLNNEVACAVKARAILKRGRTRRVTAPPFGIMRCMACRTVSEIGVYHNASITTHRPEFLGHAQRPARTVPFRAFLWFYAWHKELLSRLAHKAMPTEGSTKQPQPMTIATGAVPKALIAALSLDAHAGVLVNSWLDLPLHRRDCGSGRCARRS